MTKYNEPSFPGVFREVELQDNTAIIKKLLQELSTWQYGIKVILNRGISIDDNMDMVYVDKTFGATPNTEEAVVHTLGKVPAGYIVVIKDRAVDVYDGGTAHTKTQLNLKATVASAVVKLLVF